MTGKKWSPQGVWAWWTREPALQPDAAPGHPGAPHAAPKDVAVLQGHASVTTGRTRLVLTDEETRASTHGGCS